MAFTWAGIHPTLHMRVSSILDAMQILGYPMKPISGVRTLAEQQALYAQGRTTPGKRVTNADGVVHKSNHQPHADGYGHAVDCAFVGVDPFAETHPWKLYGAMVEAMGLKWGGGAAFLKAGINDRPHCELP